MKKLFKISIPVIFVVFAACNSDITEGDIFGNDDLPLPFKVSVKAQMSNEVCGGGLNLLNYNVTYLSDGQVFDSNNITDSITKAGAFTITGDSVNLSAADSIGIVLKLVDYNPNTPAKDFGEQLKNIQIRIANDTMDVFKSNNIEDLLICNIIQYGVQVNYNVKTGEPSITYLNGETQKSSFKFAFSAVGANNCSSNKQWTNFDIRYLQDNLPLVPVRDSITVDSTYRRTTPLEAVDKLTFILNLGNFTNVDPTLDAGEMLRNLNVEVQDADGDVLNSISNPELQNLFICLDTRHSITVDYFINTNTFEVSYGQIDFDDTGVNVVYDTVGELQESCALPGFTPSIAVGQFELSVDGTAVVPASIQTQFERMDEMAFNYGSPDLTGNLIQFKVSLSDFNPNSPNLAASNAGFKNQEFAVLDAVTSEVIFSSTDIPNLFICTDTRYQVSMTYNRATGEFAVDGLTYQF